VVPYQHLRIVHSRKYLDNGNLEAWVPIRNRS
jgi:hypothetical protein